MKNPTVNPEFLTQMAGVAYAHKWLLRQMLVNHMVRMPTAQQEASFAGILQAAEAFAITSSGEGASPQEIEAQAAYARAEIRQVVRAAMADLGLPAPQ